MYPAYCPVVSLIVPPVTYTYHTTQHVCFGAIIHSSKRQRSFSGVSLKEAIYYILTTVSVEASTDCTIFALVQSLHAKLCDIAPHFGKITSLMLAESMMTVN